MDTGAASKRGCIFGGAALHKEGFLIAVGRRNLTNPSDTSVV
jgi:hypothetical protein